MSKLHTVTTETWNIDEHPKPELCLQWMRENYHDLYGWNYENADSVKAYASAMDAILKDYSVSLCSHSYIEFVSRLDIEELHGIMLWKYLQNNGYFNLLKSECNLTGYCADDVLLQSLRKFHKNPDANTTMKDILDSAASDMVSYWLEDWQHAYSDEALTDSAEANQYYFTESGSVYQ